ncbi:hypothetical protein BHE74_00033223 [Ensete ventricosum]|nr:hypothetical protein BHE74_00033223 [Ensete ventricosum]
MRNVPEASDKRPTEAPSGQWKKTKISSRHKSRRKGESLVFGRPPQSQAGGDDLATRVTREGAEQGLGDYVQLAGPKSTGFEMGLVRMGRVSLEYGYQLALARLWAQHPDLEIEEDPFKLLPKDSNMPMADE